jgi:hypothetical protein
VSITVSAVNDAPVADAGSDQTVLVGDPVFLDGSSSSDVENNPLIYVWLWNTVPTGSTATLLNPTAVNPSFDADLPGIYVAQLIVNDGTVDSATDTVTITAELDTDGDRVSDIQDNCTLVANTDQRDTNGDGYGNMCDADLNNDGITDDLDLQIYSDAHRTAQKDPGDPDYDPNYNPDADFNGDGFINTLDLHIYKGLDLQPPGP